MSVLRSIEQKIEGLFEGVFGRAFRTHVQPVELARKLAKEMDEHRTISVSRVYVPNEYSVYLSEADREQFAGYEGSLVGELQDYLAEHARRESYALLTPPQVLMQTDADLAIGEFGIATRMVQPEGSAAAAAGRAGSPGRAGRDDDLQGEAAAADRGGLARRARGRARESFSLDDERPQARDRRRQGRARPLEGLRRPGRRRQRLAPARRAAPGGRRPGGSSTSTRRTAPR